MESGQTSKNLGLMGRIGWIVTLLAFVSGCSGYSSHYPVLNQQETEAATGIERDLKEGDRVRVTLGEEIRVEGRIHSVDPGRLVLEIEKGDSDPMVIESSQIVSIEKYSSRGETTKLIVKIVLLGLLVGAFIGFSQTDFGIH